MPPAPRGLRWVPCAIALPTAMNLPEYHPPSAQRANVAVGLAPILVLLAFTLIVTRLIDPDTGFAIFAACTVWVGYEMHAYQGDIDTYNERYVTRHLAWRSLAHLQELVDDPRTPGATRAFVLRFVQTGRALRRGAQQV